MIGKPFQPPLLRKVDKPSAPSGPDVDEHQAKKRRISTEPEDSEKPLGPQLVFKIPGISSLPRKPLLPVTKPTVAAQTTQPLDGRVEGYYNVLWRKYTNKKHKTWDGDGVLHVGRGYAYLQDVSGREMGRTACTSPLLPGSPLSIGGKEVEVDSVISKADFMAGRPFMKTSSVKPDPELKRMSLPKPQPQPKPETKADFLLKKEEAKKIINMQAPRSVASRNLFKGPLFASTVLPKKETIEPTPRYDPTTPDAIVMKRPKIVPKGNQVVDVVVDPILTKHLREHQREGGKFMYECVMRLRDFGGQGAILADEMGLGKTLQTIALLWTLLRQNPFTKGSADPPPVIKKLSSYVPLL
ncbi:hypothetical protein ABVK25_009503 [Lepraria finkii]|uniref:SNF2 N-terminal domain-containing protein n=1 Tax=Lepraria finkii TaxID=1340010 RepID=A0ABR4AXA7_9LECA